MPAIPHGEGHDDGNALLLRRRRIRPPDAADGHPPSRQEARHGGRKLHDGRERRDSATCRTRLHGIQGIARSDAERTRLAIVPHEGEEETVLPRPARIQQARQGPTHGGKRAIVKDRHARRYDETVIRPQGTLKTARTRQRRTRRRAGALRQGNDAARRHTGEEGRRRRRIRQGTKRLRPPHAGERRERRRRGKEGTTRGRQGCPTGDHRRQRKDRRRLRRNQHIRRALGEGKGTPG